MGVAVEWGRAAERQHRERDRDKAAHLLAAQR